jgi:DNA-binding HxlR family transcriptional regulator
VQHQLKLSPNTVSERLRTLVRAGLLSRHVFHEVPPRVEYRVTPKLLELEPVFASLQAWSKRNDLDPVSAASSTRSEGASAGMVRRAGAPSSSYATR